MVFLKNVKSAKYLKTCEWFAFQSLWTFTKTILFLWYSLKLRIHLFRVESRSKHRQSAIQFRFRNNSNIINICFNALKWFTIKQNLINLNEINNLLLSSIKLMYSMHSIWLAISYNHNTQCSYYLYLIPFNVNVLFNPTL